MLTSHVLFIFSRVQDKRSDMLSLSNRLTVPQIFFNEQHIGGAEETLNLLQKWDKETNVYQSPLERYQKTIEMKPNPTDLRLEIPSNDTAVKSTPPPPPRSPHQMDNEFQLPVKQQSFSYVQIFQTMLNILPRKNKAYRGRYYQNCFTGKQGVETIMSHYDLNLRNDAISFLTKLYESKMIHKIQSHKSVVYSKTPNTNNITLIFVDNDSILYRLSSFSNPRVLNSMRSWTDRVDPNPNRLVLHLKEMLDKVIQAASKDNEQGKIDYLLANKNQLFHTFQEATCELQKIDMKKMDQKTRLAFGINLYNLMILHAFIQLGIPTSNYQRSSFFSNVGYNVGGHIFSFNELEHGVLRGNRKVPYALSHSFSSTDDRLAISLDKVDPRIHFALNCGANSCPPINKFKPESIDEELRIVSESFQESDENVLVDDINHVLTLSMIYKWYMDDFSSSKSQLAQFIIRFLRGKKKQILQTMIDSKIPIKVKFFNYDWNTNALNMKAFNNRDLQDSKLALSALKIF